jgi:hypothetical protein
MVTSCNYIAHAKLTRHSALELNPNVKKHLRGAHAFQNFAVRFPLMFLTSENGTNITMGGPTMKNVLLTKGEHHEIYYA